jgi:hypothetical protein
MDLEGVARALYRVPPEDFVAERTARARNVRSRDRALATAIGALRKPAPAAWIVDLLAADGSLDEAVALGPTLRDAQAGADPTEIRRLRKERTRLVVALARTGAERAEAAGHRATDTVLEQVRGTVEAAMSDPRAGAAVRSGLLVRPLMSAGFDDVDLDGAVAVPEALPFPTTGHLADVVPMTVGRRGPGRRSAARPADPDPGEDGPDHPAGEADVSDRHRASRPSGGHVRTGRRRTEEAARDQAPTEEAARDRAPTEEAAAREESRAADVALDQAEAALVEAGARRAELGRRRAELERQLAALDAERRVLDDETAGLERARDAAETASDDARDAFTAARRRRRDAR